MIVLQTALVVCLLVLLSGCRPNEAACPPAIDQAKRLVRVITPSMDDTRATVATFQRPSPRARWTQTSGPESAVVGEGGVAWGHPFAASAQPGEPIKREGDKRTPAGIYAFTSTFGFGDANRPGHIRLASGRHYCVDDVRSPHYGRIVSKSVAGDGISGEEMATIPHYKRGIVIDYPPLSQSRAGSCIFIHIWEGEGIGTDGCVALPEARVAHLQEWVTSDQTAIAILPANALDRFKGCLPQ